MAHPTSLPTTASSIRTFASYRRAVSSAPGSSSARVTLLTPKDEPERAGFTKTGYGSRSGSTFSLPSTTQGFGVAIPALPATVYARALSMHTAELRMSHPT